MDWSRIFDNWGIKTVARNDVVKKAYVPNAGQRHALASAGFVPAPDSNSSELVTMNVLLDPDVNTVTASYYLTLRSEQAGRRPEPRMGRQLIREWLEPGDELLVGNIGSQVYVLKTGQLADGITGTERLAAALPAEVIRARAAAASGPAERRSVSRTEFVRNPYVVAAALLRAQGRCEMLGCTREPFFRSDGTPYLEVHHLIPLAEDGPDTLSNVAALCPSCHREVHHGIHAARQTAAVLAHVAAVAGTGGQQ